MSVTSGGIGQEIGPLRIGTQAVDAPMVFIWQKTGSGSEVVSTLIKVKDVPVTVSGPKIVLP